MTTVSLTAAIGVSCCRKRRRGVGAGHCCSPVALRALLLVGRSVGRWAVNNFMHSASGLGRTAAGFRILRNRPAAPGDSQLVIRNGTLTRTATL